MLIKDNKLDIEEFKTFFDKLKWLKLPRKLGQNHTEHFYVGKYEDDERIIKITLRPSLRMQVSESFKNYTLRGELAPKDYKQETCNWGATIEVIASKSMAEKILEVCEELPEKTKQVLEW